MSLMITILILLVVSRIGGEISERFGQPAMIGEIFAGILLGPSLLNFIHITPELTTIANLGVLMIVLLMGFEINIVDVGDGFRGRNIWISLIVFFIPLITGIAVGIIFLLDVMRIIFIGLCMSITAISLNAQILSGLGKEKSFIGKKIISVSLANTVLALLMLGVILGVDNSEMEKLNFDISIFITLGKVVLFIVGVYVGSRLIRFAIRFLYVPNYTVLLILSKLKGKESLFAITLLFIMLFVAFSEFIGFHFIIGTFFGALLINEDVMGKKNYEQIQTTASGITMGFLAPIFFSTIGLQFDISKLFNWQLLSLIIVAAILSKIISGYIGGLLAGMNSEDSLTLGIGVNGRGVIQIVIVNIALSNGFIASRLFSMLVLMGMFTTIITPPLLKRAFKLKNKEILSRNA